MRKVFHSWLLGLIGIIGVILVPLVLFTEPSDPIADTPWEHVPKLAASVDHSDLFLQREFKTGQEVTQACVECHQDAAQQVMHTTHWTWQAEPVVVEGRSEPISIGKKNTINNFCIGIQGNWEGCSACHAGYGWENEAFDFRDQANVDCIVCHDQTQTYKKGKKGLPVEGVDLLEVAKSVGRPSRTNCGSCHFKGGGGNAVKHGDLDESLSFPEERLDVHMGRYQFVCVDCHKTRQHDISGRSISVSVDNKNQIFCTDCHKESLHKDERVSLHVDSVACQTCHIPTVAKKDATKTRWDWSQAGDANRPEDPHHYLKMKGSFVYEKQLEPSYLWFNGLADRYLLGDPIQPTEVTDINAPKGSISDPKAKIWPFKIHTAKQPYDVKYRHLLQPKTVGKDGYWSHYDWNEALSLGSSFAGIQYSGSFNFAETAMYWPQTHMVAPKEDALQCQDCHGENSRFDWEALGYIGDPIKWGIGDRRRALNKEEASYESSN
jgi:octaheme c-type cytochrome (tetrathionate reductase family)